MAPRLIDPRIKLRHVVCFLEVARLRSMVKAAELLNMSQPAASKTIQELEQVLGVQLFDRNRRSLVLTRAGEAFQRHTTTSLSALKQGVDAVLESSSPHIVRVGALPTVSGGMLPAVTFRFTAQQTRYRVRVVTGPNDYLLSLLRGGELDIVLGRMAEPDEIAGLSFEHLYAERIVFVVRPEHPLLKRRRFTLDLVEDYQVLFPPPGSAILPHAERLLAAHGVSTVRDDIETVANTFGRRYVRNSDAVWIISEGVVAEDVRAGDLALLPVDTTESYGSIGLTTRSGREFNDGVDLFVRVTREVAAEHTPL